MTATGGASFRINDKLSLGAMLRMVFAKLEQKAAINNPVQPDGRLKFEDDDLSGEGLCAGWDSLSPAVSAYDDEFHFSGTIRQVVVELSE